MVLCKLEVVEGLWCKREGGELMISWLRVKGEGKLAMTGEGGGVSKLCWGWSVSYKDQIAGHYLADWLVML